MHVFVLLGQIQSEGNDLPKKFYHEYTIIWKWTFKVTVKINFTFKLSYTEVSKDIIFLRCVCFPMETRNVYKEVQSYTSNTRCNMIVSIMKIDALKIFCLKFVIKIFCTIVNLNVTNMVQSFRNTGIVLRLGVLTLKCLTQYIVWKNFAKFFRSEFLRNKF